MAEYSAEKPVFPMGEIVAERRFTLYEESGVARQVIVKLESLFLLVCWVLA